MKKEYMILLTPQYRQKLQEGAAQLSKMGLEVSKIIPSGIITGFADDSLFETLRNSPAIVAEIRDTELRRYIAPPDSAIQ